MVETLPPHVQFMKNKNYIKIIGRGECGHKVAATHIPAKDWEDKELEILLGLKKFVCRWCISKEKE